MYLQALWEANWVVIRNYSFLNILQFMLLAFTIIFFPMSVPMMGANAICSCIMLLLEARQICTQKSLYFKDAYNYLDVLSNSFIVMTFFNLLRLGE